MATVHWFAESGEVDPQAVCTVDFADEGMAVDFAHHLYRSVHGFGRSRLGFAIRDDDGTTLYAWRWDGTPLDREPDEQTPARLPEAALPAAPSPPEASSPSLRPTSQKRARRTPLRETLNEWAGQAVAWAIRVAAPFGHLRGKLQGMRPRFSPGLQGVAAKVRRSAGSLPSHARRLPSIWQRLSSIWRRLTRWERPVDPGSRGRRPPSARRWQLEIDHYLLAVIVVLAVLCGSPLYSVYSTVQRLQHDESLARNDKTGVAAATRAAAKTVLSTEGKLDFRKLFWHLRIVGPTEIDLLAYEPGDGDGPRLIFESSDMLRWHLRRVRGVDGTWWAKADTARHAS